MPGRFHRFAQGRLLARERNASVTNDQPQRATNQPIPKPRLPGRVADVLAEVPTGLCDTIRNNPTPPTPWNENAPGDNTKQKGPMVPDHDATTQRSEDRTIRAPDPSEDRTEVADRNVPIDHVMIVSGTELDILKKHAFERDPDAAKEKPTQAQPLRYAVEKHAKNALTKLKDNLEYALIRIKNKVFRFLDTHPKKIITGLFIYLFGLLAITYFPNGPINLLSKLRQTWEIIAEGNAKRDTVKEDWQQEWRESIRYNDNFVRGRVANLWTKMYNIEAAVVFYNHVLENIKYSPVPVNQSAPTKDISVVFATGTGNCKDHAAALASIIEAAGGVARIVIESGHAYVEIKLGTMEREENKNTIENLIKKRKIVRNPKLVEDEKGLWIAVDATTHALFGTIVNETRNQTPYARIYSLQHK